MTIAHFARLACEFFRQLCCSLFELIGALDQSKLLWQGFLDIFFCDKTVADKPEPRHYSRE
jgi:hypothetical protein